METTYILLFTFVNVLLIHGASAYQRNEEKVASQKNDIFSLSDFSSLQNGAQAGTSSISDGVELFGASAGNLDQSAGGQLMGDSSQTGSFESQISNFVNTVQDSIGNVGKTGVTQSDQSGLSGLNLNSGQSNLGIFGGGHFSNQLGQQGMGVGAGLSHLQNGHSPFEATNAFRNHFNAGLHLGGHGNHLNGNLHLQAHRGGNNLPHLGRDGYGNQGGRHGLPHAMPRFPGNVHGPMNNFHAAGQNFNRNMMNTHAQHMASVQNMMAQRSGNQAFPAGPTNIQNGIQAQAQQQQQQHGMPQVQQQQLQHGAHHGFKGPVLYQNQGNGGQNGNYGGNLRRNQVQQNLYGQITNNIQGNQQQLPVTTPVPNMPRQSLVQKLLGVLTGSTGQQAPGFPSQMPPTPVAGPSQMMGGGITGFQQSQTIQGNMFPGPASSPPSVQQPGAQSAVPQGYVINAQGQRQQANMPPSQVQRQPQQMQPMGSSSSVPPAPNSKTDIISMLMEIIKGQRNGCPSASMNPPAPSQYGQSPPAQNQYLPRQLPGMPPQNMVPPSPSSPPMQFGGQMQVPPQGRVSQGSFAPGPNMQIQPSAAPSVPGQNTQNALVQKLLGILGPAANGQPVQQQQNLPRVPPIMDVVRRQTGFPMPMPMPMPSPVNQQQNLHGNQASMAVSVPGPRIQQGLHLNTPYNRGPQMQMQMNIQSRPSFNIQQPMAAPLQGFNLNQRLTQQSNAQKRKYY